MPELTGVEIVILLVFAIWCVGVFFFLRRMSARGKKSAAEPDPARRGMDELIAKLEERHPPRDSKEPPSNRKREGP